LFGFSKIRQLCYHHPAASLATLLHDPLTTTRMTKPLPGLDEEEEKDWQPTCLDWHLQCLSSNKNWQQFWHASARLPAEITQANSQRSNVYIKHAVVNKSILT
jgi:hypothetical protein